MTGNTNTTIKDKSNIVIATIRVEDRKVVITYTEKYINSGTNTSLNGDFFVEGEVDLSQLNKMMGRQFLQRQRRHHFRLWSRLFRKIW